MVRNAALTNLCIKTKTFRTLFQLAPELHLRYFRLNCSRQESSRTVTIGEGDRRETLLYLKRDPLFQTRS